MRLEIVPSGQFRKDLKLAQKRGLDLHKLTKVIDALADGETLEPKYRDHALTGLAVDLPSGRAAAFAVFDKNRYAQRPILIYFSSGGVLPARFSLRGRGRVSGREARGYRGTGCG